MEEEIDAEEWEQASLSLDSSSIQSSSSKRRKIWL